MPRRTQKKTVAFNRHERTRNSKSIIIKLEQLARTHEEERMKLQKEWETKKRKIEKEAQ